MSMNLRRSNGRALTGGYSMNALTICMVLLAVGLVGSTWIERSTAVASANASRHSQAVAIAHGQSDVVQGLPFAQLAPTSGFERASWVAQPGFKLGQVPVQIWVDGVAETEAPIVYDVSYRSEDADRSGRLRRVQIRVDWTNADDTRGRYTLETVRAG